MENKNFEPDPNEHQFTITLKVYKNCQTLSVSPVMKREVTYQEVMGAIELSKLSQFTEQNITNMKRWIEVKELQNSMNNEPEVQASVATGSDSSNEADKQNQTP